MGASRNQMKLLADGKEGSAGGGKRGGVGHAHPWEALADNFFDPCQLCGLQRRMEAANLKLVQLLIVQRTILQAPVTCRFTSWDLAKARGRC